MFGTNVALSADGNTALIGGWNDDSVLLGNQDYSGKGAAWVFTRSGATWTQQGAKLTARGRDRRRQVRHDRRALRRRRHGADRRLERRHQQGRGLGVHALGWGLDPAGAEAHRRGRDRRRQVRRQRRALRRRQHGADRRRSTTTAPGARRGCSCARARTWTQQGGKLTGGGEAGEGEFGTNVALSADGDTALIGGWRDNSGTGAAWVFVDPPTATTGAATSIGETGATLNGTLGAGGSSKAYFQYGTTAAYGASTAIQSVGASGSSSPLAAAIGGLAPGTTYHFRLVAENSGGVAYGGDQTFKSEAPSETSTTTSTTETTTTPVVHVTSTSSSVPSETSLPPLWCRTHANRRRDGVRAIGSPASAARRRPLERPSRSRSTSRQP